ncbi:hypothetical protein YK48G_25300 [Lentilactobacillus fungorum]|uniref:Alkaline shock response membrane anchor protein AmaP n=1 Tax=Lentilactobacillus fungorum TaxID=2201250 RepID=A0ABQ3W2S3_9LACO|nr:alkaline shock response membrane anchor protein AmaP [Lentilactobacillus fungorum]GHP15105.1 hypothetical protein YK48G_25300 [Lentilactobacillus fungorum]
MSRLTKLLVLLISIILIVQSVWFVALVVPIDYLSKLALPSIQTNVDWLMVLALGLSIVVGIVGVVAMIIIMFAPKKANRLVFQSTTGKLSISKKAVEKSLNEAIMQQAAVVDVDSTVKLQTRNRLAKVTVIAVDKQGRDLVNLGERIQAIVADKIADLMAVKVKKVKVKVKPYDSLPNKRRANHPRVV